MVYAVAFKRPRSGTLRWVYCLEANTPMEASRVAKAKAGEREYGISGGIYILVTPKGSKPWLLHPSRVPDDVRMMKAAA